MKRLAVIAMVVLLLSATSAEAQLPAFYNYLPLTWNVVYVDAQCPQLGSIVNVPSWEHGAILQIQSNVCLKWTWIRDSWGQTYYANGVYIVMLAYITNTGIESGSVSNDDLRLRDGEGRIFDLASAGVQWAAQDAIPSAATVHDRIQPGFTKFAVFVFDVLPTSRDFTLLGNNP